MINPREKLFKWGPIDGLPIYPAYWYPAMFGWHWPVGFMYFEEKKFVYVCDYRALYDLGEKVFFKYIWPDRKFKDNYQKWQKLLVSFVKIKNRIMTGQLKKMSQKELTGLFSEWNRLYLDFWRIGLLPELANWGGEQILNRELKKKIKNDQDFNYVLERLSAPEFPSFYQKEELDLLVLRKVRNKALIEKKLARHQKNYFWLLNSYHQTRILNQNYFEKILNFYSLKKAREKVKAINQLIKEARVHKKPVIKKFNLPLSLLKISQRLSFCIWWQDLRKSYIFQANHLIDLFLKEFSNRFDINFLDLHYYKIEELEKLARENKKVSRQKIRKRQGKLLMIFHGRRGLKYLTGARAKKLIKPYLEQKIDRKLRLLKGLVVSQGRARGLARIIHSAREVGKMHKGNILVASMTSPDYITALRKAAAVVTDEGGLTCHAAIVARELKIPCIVGTKIATKVLRDGDIIEVDAAGGIIKKIERKHD